MVAVDQSKARRRRRGWIGSEDNANSRAGVAGRHPARVMIEAKTDENHKFHDVLAKARDIAKKKGVKLDAEVVAGHAVSAIVAYVKAHKADLLVVGFMGHSALYERIIGGTADRLVRLAPCPVLVVK